MELRRKKTRAAIQTQSNLPLRANIDNRGIVLK